MKNGSRWGPIWPPNCPGDHAAGPVDQPLGQDDRRRQVVRRAATASPTTEAIDGQSVGRGWRSPRKPGGGRAPPGQHEVMPERVVVRRVRQRADHGPVAGCGGPAAAGARRSRCPASRWRSGWNSPRISVGRVGLQVEALVLRQAARRGRCRCTTSPCPRRARRGRQPRKASRWFIPRPSSPRRRPGPPWPSDRRMGKGRRGVRACPTSISR